MPKRAAMLLLPPLELGDAFHLGNCKDWSVGGGSLVGKKVLQVIQLGQVTFFTECIGRIEQGCCDPVTPGGSAQAQVNASREHRLQEAEILCHFQGTVIREHDTAGADADMAGF
jgi:hypothetical protein